MNILELAEIQLQRREGMSTDNPDYMDKVFLRAKKIRHYLDMQAEKIEKTQFKKLV